MGATSSSSDGQDARHQHPTNSMRFPLEMAQEIGSFLSLRDLIICTTRLCVNGVVFVSIPVADMRTTAMVQLHALIASLKLYETIVKSCMKKKKRSKCKQEPASVAPKVVGRIESYLARRPHIDRLFFVADERHAGGRNTPIFGQIDRHFQTRHKTMARDKLTNGSHKALVVRWHVRADSVDVAARYRELHTLDMSKTAVSDLSPLVTCRFLCILDLSHTRVVDVSALWIMPGN
jgi:hypothetical protein